LNNSYSFVKDWTVYITKTTHKPTGMFAWLHKCCKSKLNFQSESLKVELYWSHIYIGSNNDNTATSFSVQSIACYFSGQLILMQRCLMEKVFVGLYAQWENTNEVISAEIAFSIHNSWWLIVLHLHVFMVCKKLSTCFKGRCCLLSNTSFPKYIYSNTDTLDTIAIGEYFSLHKSKHQLTSGLLPFPDNPMIHWICMSDRQRIVVW